MSRAAPDQPRKLDGYALVYATGFDEAGAAAVRREVGRAAVASGLSPDRTDVFLVAVYEIMTNAVRHGGGGGQLRLWRNGELLCEVDDVGEGFAAAAHLARTEAPAPTSSGGRGLWLARQMSDRIAIDSGPTGTTVQVGVLVLAARGASSGR